MSITFESRLLPEYLLLECSGNYELDAILRVYQQAFALATEAGRDAILIDARNVTGREPTLTERYDQAVFVTDLQSARTPRIRLTLLGNEPLIHPERFGEIVATNRGALARVFTDDAMAFNWLVPKPKQA